VSATACALLRHDVRPRWIGDLLAMWCHTCQPGHLLIPEPAPASGALASPRQDSARSGAHAVPATAEPPPPA
jgi:hypothetical protein